MGFGQVLQLVKTLKEQTVGAVWAHWYDFSGMSGRKVTPIHPSWRKQIPELGGHTYEVSMFNDRIFVIKAESKAKCVLDRFDV